jgi:ABC-2 type transport system ATP-binding protein
VLDELTTGLDPQARRGTWDLVGAARERLVTLVLVTHDMEQAEDLCRRVALVDAGRWWLSTRPSVRPSAPWGKRLRLRPLATSTSRC